MEELNVYQVLTDLGYQLKDYGKEFRTKPLYRESDNDTVLRIYKDTGKWFDFSQNISGDINSLVSLTLKLDSPDKAKEWLKNKNFNTNSINFTKKPLLKSTKKFDIELLSKLDKDHKYWINRGIRKDTLDIFLGGLAYTGKMKNRYVFPIFDINKNIIGFSGRDTRQNSTIKWKHLGEKNEFLYPIFLNNNIITEKREVILVESIGDMLNLWQSGVQNVIVTFGVNISLAILNYCLRIDPKKIYISLNDDSKNNNVGNLAADKALSKLKRYFDTKQLQIKLPFQKDFGEMTPEQIKEWSIK